MACERCGDLYSWSSHSCPTCSKPIKYGLTAEEAKASREAGETLGRGLVEIVAAPFLNKYLVFPTFVIGAFAGFVVLAPILGLSDIRWDPPPPGWYVGIAVFTPFIAAFLLRKQIPKIMAAILALLSISAICWVIYKLFF